MSSGLGRGFARDVTAILETVQLGYQINEVFLYPWEVRENLRRAGMKLDRKTELPDFAEMLQQPDYEPDFGPDEVVEDEDYDVIDDGEDQ